MDNTSDVLAIIVLGVVIVVCLVLLALISLGGKEVLVIEDVDDDYDDYVETDIDSDALLESLRQLRLEDARRRALPEDGETNRLYTKVIVNESEEVVVSFVPNMTIRDILTEAGIDISQINRAEMKTVLRQGKRSQVDDDPSWLDCRLLPCSTIYVTTQSTDG